MNQPKQPITHNALSPEAVAERLKTFPVFGKAGKPALRHLVTEGGVRQIRVCEKQRINHEVHGIFCIISGCAAVYSRDEERPVLLRYLHKGDLFGIASVYSENPAFSLVEARTDTELLEVSREAVSELLGADQAFREAFVTFLSERVRFLNLRIACVSAGSAERKLGLYLCSVSSTDQFELPISMSDLANLLDLGRASLYRAFDKLISLGYIRRDGAHIELTDRMALLTMKH